MFWKVKCCFEIFLSESWSWPCNFLMFIFNFFFWILIFFLKFFFQIVGIAWTTIFVLIGIASWRVYTIGKQKQIDVRVPLFVYAVNLITNWMWPVVAFQFDWLLGAIILMTILLFLVVLTGGLFYRVDRISGLLFIPYFIYLLYATILCIHIYILNN